MATRPIFVPDKSGRLAVREMMVQFIWSPGMAVIQKQRNVTAIHEAAREFGIERILEVSTRSKSKLGIALSAFNLTLHLKGVGTISVESAFQGGKVFRKGGPYTDLYAANSHKAKRDPRLNNSGPLVAFRIQGQLWPLEPKTAFYDWLYITALQQHTELASELLDYDGFTDIEFNPRKSFSTQARSCALYVALLRSGKLEEALTSKEEFLSCARVAYNPQRLKLPRLL